MRNSKIEIQNEIFFYLYKKAFAFNFRCQIPDDDNRRVQARLFRGIYLPRTMRYLTLLCGMGKPIPYGCFVLFSIYRREQARLFRRIYLPRTMHYLTLSCGMGKPIPYGFVDLVPKMRCFNSKQEK